MGRAMISKYLIQFSTWCWGCVLSLLLGLRPNCWPKPPHRTPGHSQASLTQSLVGTLLLSLSSWCAQGFVCALHESLFPVLWMFCNQIPLAFKVKIPWEFSIPLLDPQVGKSIVGPRTFITVRELLWYNCSPVCGLSAQWLYGGVHMPSLSATARAFIPTAGSHCWPVAPQERLKHSKAGLAQSPMGSLGPGAHKILFEPSEHLWKVWGLILNVISSLLPCCLGFSFALGSGVSFFFFFGGIQHSPVDGCSAVSCNFGVLTDDRKSFYSAILWIQDQTSQS